jgi:hypothetical protein
LAFGGLEFGGGGEVVGADQRGNGGESRDVGGEVDALVNWDLCGFINVEEQVE